MIILTKWYLSRFDFFLFLYVLVKHISLIFRANWYFTMHRKSNCSYFILLLLLLLYFIFFLLSFLLSPFFCLLIFSLIFSISSSFLFVFCFLSLTLPFILWLAPSDYFPRLYGWTFFLSFFLDTTGPHLFAAVTERQRHASLPPNAHFRQQWTSWGNNFCVMIYIKITIFPIHNWLFHIKWPIENQSTYLSSNILSTESDVNITLSKR